MNNYGYILRAFLLGVLISCLYGCGDHSNTLPWGDQLDVFPSTIDLSNQDAYYRSIDITFAPFDDKGNPFTGGSALIWINDGAKGFLVAGDQSGRQLSLDFDDKTVNCWYRYTKEEETVTVFASAEQYPHTNFVSKNIYIVNQVLAADFDYSTSGLNVSFINGSVPSSGNSVNGLTYSWDFGDNAGTDDVRNPQYTYGAAATYLVTLTTTENGVDSEVTALVEVTASATP